MIHELEEAIHHLKNMIGYTFDPKGHREFHVADVADIYHKEKQSAIDFVRRMEAQDEREREVQN